MEDAKEETKKPKTINVDDTNYLIYHQLEIGSFGLVYLVEKEKDKDKKKYAMKILIKSDDESRKEFENEINIYEHFNKISNDYIPKLIAHDEIVINKYESPKKVFIMDFFENKDVEDYILTKKCGLEERYSKYIFKRILEEIQYLHSNNICHLDIKPNNFLLNDDYDPMVIDFGFAVKVDKLERGQKTCTQSNGNKNFKSPESFNKNKPYSGIEADIFGLGVLLIYLVTGLNKINKIYDNIKNEDYEKFWKQWEEYIKAKINDKKTKEEKKRKLLLRLNKLTKITPELKNLYVKMIAFKPEKRIDISKIIDKDHPDPWLKEIYDIESDKDKFEEFKKEYKNYMEGIIKIPNILSKIIKNINEITVPKRKNKTKGISSVKNEEEGHFDLNMKPKKLIAEKYNYKYFMKLNGELNPAEFMNIVKDEMEKKYNDDCLIEKSDEKLKLTVKLGKKKM